MASVTFDGATCQFRGSDTPAVDSLDLEIADGEFLVLVGPSGCGKSTSLRMLAGLEETTAGRILIGDRDVTGLEPKDRDIAMVFQNYALYPHMTVAENMGFPLKMAKMPKDAIAAKVREVAKILDLEPYLDRKPKALSGGQRQRVAMGRSIVREPQVFCMDEPLSNLDAKLRVQTRTQIAQLQRRLAVTTVYVTHDQVEAMTMGDRVAVLNDGVLQQCATPRDLYRSPGNVFVAGFIGSPAMNLFTVQWQPEGVQIGGLQIPLPRTLPAAMGTDQIVVGIRPEDLTVVPAGSAPAGPGRRVPPPPSFPGGGWVPPEQLATQQIPASGAGSINVVVDVVEELGSDAYLYGRTVVDGNEATIVARADWRVPPSKGDRLQLTTEPSRVHLFSAVDGTRIS